MKHTAPLLQIVHCYKWCNCPLCAGVTCTVAAVALVPGGKYLKLGHCPSTLRDEFLNILYSVMMSH